MIVIDLEGTCCDDNSILPKDRETIEIGAVCLSSGDIVSEFSSFVRPVIHKKLTQFCTDLTGIIQADVDSADTFPHVWNNEFIPWLCGDKSFCSWGRYDLEQFKRDRERNSLSPYFEKHCDLSRVSGKNKRLVMKRFGLVRTGRQHRGLDDAKNVARILAKMLERGKQIKFNKV